MENDESFEDTVLRELAEESQVEVKIIRPLEPWLYTIGNIRTVIIVPFECDALIVPDTMTDNDGGSVGRHDPSDLSELNIPQGYLDNLLGVPPRHSRTDIVFPDEMVERARLFKKPEYSPEIFIELKVGAKTYSIIPEGLMLSDGMTSGSTFFDIAVSAAAQIDANAVIIGFDHAEIDGSELLIKFSCS